MTKTSLVFLAILPLFMTSCNLYGGISHPSSDPQYLVAARSCLDHGDYQCALDNYKKLSSSYNDVYVSETSLTTLAQNNIFSISDLVGSLGTSLGSAGSFAFLAQALEVRNITSGTYRTTIKTVWDNDGSIQDTHLLAFSRFIAAIAMFNEILANAVGSDGILTASDIVTTPSTCKSSSGGNAVACAGPAGTGMGYAGGDGTTFASTAAAWGGAATIQKLIAAAVEASNDYTGFSGGTVSNSGLLTAIQAFSSLPGTEPLARYTLLGILGL